jgi:hypothetical protein
MPGSLTYTEFQRHIDNKIKAGRREATSIDDQIARCYELLGLLDVIDEHAALLTAETREEASPSLPPRSDARQPAVRRRTISGLPMTPGDDSSKLEKKTPDTANVAPSPPFYSDMSASEHVHDSPSTIRPGLTLLKRSTSLKVAPSNLPNAARLSKPFEYDWEAGDLGAYASDEGDQPFDGQPDNTDRGYDGSRFYPSSDNWRYIKDKPLPPVHRTSTPRTESTAELLGSLGSELLLQERRPYTSGSHAASLPSHCDGLMSPQSAGSIHSDGRAQQQGYKWHSQRGAGSRAKQKRRHSKADELLGFYVPESPTRAGSVMGSKDSLSEQSEGKKSKLSLLKLSKLRRSKGET